MDQRAVRGVARGGGVSGAVAERTRGGAQRRASRAGEQEHLQRVARRNPHSWVAWLVAAVPLSGISAPLATLNPVSALGVRGGGAGLVVDALSIELTVALVYLLVLGTARAALTGFPPVEILKWALSGERARTLASVILVPTALLALTVVSGLAPNPAHLDAVMLISAFVAGYRALVLAYRTQYLEVVLSPVGVQQYTFNLKTRSRLRRGVEWVTATRSLTSRHRMIAPALQTGVVLYALPALWSLLLGSLHVRSNLAYALPAVPLLVLSVWGWSRWHLYGGLGRVLRRKGRPMRPLL